jgi:hypothetical protein
VLVLVRARTQEFVFLLAMVLALRPHEVAPAPLLIAGTAGYVGSVIWRVVQLNWRWLTRIRFWLYRRGHEMPVRQSPRTPVVIAGGTSLFLLVPDWFSLIALAGLVLATAVTSSEWRRARFGPPIRGMTAAASANVLGLAWLVAVAGSALLWVAPSSAADVLPQLVGVQIALGLLPLTALTFATQFVAGAAGAGATSVLPWWRVGAVIAFVLASIAYDFYLLGSAVRPGDLEWAETIAFVAIGTSILASVDVTYFLRPGHVARALVGRLDVPWLDEVARKYQEPYQPWLGPDPFRDIERLLYIAATRESDIRLFNRTVQDLEERLRILAQRRQPSEPPRVEVGLDEYLARALSALLDDAARQRKGWVLESLIWFREQISDYVVEGEPRTPPSRPFIERTSFGDPPSGLQLLGRILESAIEGGLEDEGRRAVFRIAQYVEQRLPSLPDPSGVWDIDPAAEVKFQADAPAQHASDAIEDVLRKLQGWADDAARKDRDAIGDTLADAVAAIAGASRELTDARWAGWLAREGVSTSYRIALEGVRKQRLWYEPPTRHQEYTRTNPSHVAVVEAMSFWTPFTLATCAPVASYMLVVDATMLGLAWIKEFPQEAGAIAAALEYIKRRRQHLPVTNETAIVIREIDGRLNQLRAGVGPHGDTFEQTRAQFFERLKRELEPAPEGGGEVS